MRFLDCWKIECNLTIDTAISTGHVSKLHRIPNRATSAGDHSAAHLTARTDNCSHKTASTPSCITANSTGRRNLIRAAAELRFCGCSRFDVPVLLRR